MSKAFMITPGDGRPTANAFWMPDHAKIIPRVEKALRKNDLEPVWLHDQGKTVCSHFMAAKIARKLVAKAQDGDKLVVLTTGWNWPAHAGIVFTANQEMIRSGKLQAINICNMKEKAPGYVGQRANVLAFEIMQLPYDCLTVIDQSDEGWMAFGSDLKNVLNHSYEPSVPNDEVEITGKHEGTAKDAIRLLRESASIVPLVNVASMTMYQGWPNLYEFMKLGLTPIFVGSNEFQKLMAEISIRRVLETYEWLKNSNLQFCYESGGLCEEEIFLALRMYLVKLDWYMQGAMGMGTQGQMEQISIVATDLSESLMMSTMSPGKNQPVIDVTEADCEALISSMLGQAILYIKFGKRMPVGFHDIRHYCIQEDTLVLLNSGALALDYLTDSPGDYSDIRVVSQNRKVYFLQGGGCIEGNMQPAKNTTLFRLHGAGSTYKMKTASMNILPLSWKKRQEVYGELDHWPMGIVQIPDGRTKDTTLSWLPNHGQHTQENILPELAAACKLLEYDFSCFATVPND